MKKIYAILAAAAALVATACNKVEITEPESENVTVDIMVSSLTPDTKAVKTGWTSGDIINVYLDDASDYEPDFTLTYNGSSWESSTLSDAVKGRLKENGGKLHGFWEGGNSLTDLFGDDSRIFFRGEVTSYGSVGKLVADFYEIAYTYSGGILRASINSWRFQTTLQVVVSGLLYEKERYALYSDDVLNLKYISVNDGTPKTCKIVTSGQGKLKRLGCIENSDGIAFVGVLADGYDNDLSHPFKFYLVDRKSDVVYEFSKTATLSSASNTKVAAVKIPFNKFVVDMGLNVKWAATNLGADTFTDYGDFYAWGETVPYYISQDPLTWKTGKTGYNWASYQWNPSGNGSTFTRYTGSDYVTLQPGDDAAAAAYGGSYRMPTRAECDELLNADNCDKAWVTDYLGTGINGYLFTSKKEDKTKQKVFLPAAGYRANAVYARSGVEGNFWSSSLHSSSNEACNLGFIPSSAGTTHSSRYMGFPVRPVYTE